MKRRTHKPEDRAKSFTIGRTAFAKISAVEGIHMKAAMDEQFREFDRKGRSAEERRRIISKKYGDVG